MTADDTAGVHLTDAERRLLITELARGINGSLIEVRAIVNRVVAPAVESILAARAARSGQGEAVAAVLARHAWQAALGGCPPSCGWVGNHGEDGEDEQEQHAHHVAAALTAASTTAQDAEGGEVERLRSEALRTRLVMGFRHRLGLAGNPAEATKWWADDLADLALKEFGNERSSWAEAVHIAYMQGRLAGPPDPNKPGEVDDPDELRARLDALTTPAHDRLRAVLDRDTPNGGGE